jgi:hypothetical protein
MTLEAYRIRNSISEEFTELFRLSFAYAGNWSGRQGVWWPDGRRNGDQLFNHSSFLHVDVFPCGKEIFSTAKEYACVGRYSESACLDLARTGFMQVITDFPRSTLRV